PRSTVLSSRKYGSWPLTRGRWFASALRTRGRGSRPSTRSACSSVFTEYGRIATRLASDWVWRSPRALSKPTAEVLALTARASAARGSGSRCRVPLDRRAKMGNEVRILLVDDDRELIDLLAFAL